MTPSGRCLPRWGGRENGNRTSVSTDAVTRISEPSVVAVLERDPDLADGLRSDEFDEACRRCLALSFTLPRGSLGRWPLEAQPDPELLGYLVLSGFLARTVMIDARHSAEVLGPGDLVRPWGAPADATIEPGTRWRVSEPATIAVLDRTFHRCAVRWPQLSHALLDRAFQRSRSLMLRLAIAEVPSIARRVKLVLWHLAERWARVGPHGTVLSLRISQSTLADLVCASRESVSRALADLRRYDLVHVVDEGFLLRGGSPAELQAAVSGEPVVPVVG